MHWASKSTSQAKRVSPPSIPLDSYSSSTGKLLSVNNSDSNSTNSIDDGLIYRNKDNIMEYGFTNIPKMPSNFNPNGFVGREPLTHKAAVYYHQQLALQEDQGIDLAQSPGRDSPSSSSESAGSGSRHSTASLDSGRASSYVTGYASTRGQFLSPRCGSVSSCSIGSFDRISQRSENDVILDWLSDIKFEDYIHLFTAAGYDLPTISRMTPEDLTAVGITNPQHRERIKRHIEKLHIPDNLPDFIPASIEEWLRFLQLEEYIQPLLDQNYKTVKDATQITWEDLEDIGIVKLGHQKKILLAIKRAKDILSGKRGGVCAANQQNPISPLSAKEFTWNNANCITQYPSEVYNASNVVDGAKDLVLIKVRQPRGKSLESLEDVNERNTRSYLTFSHYSTGDPAYNSPKYNTAYNKSNINPNSLDPAVNLAWRRSYDDGDITPTNESLQNEHGGGTLPRQRTANYRSQLNALTPANDAAINHAQNAIQMVEYGPLSNPHCDMAYHANKDIANYATSKKVAPDPPKRKCSMRNKEEFHVGDGNADAINSYSMHSQQYIPQNYGHPIYVNFSAIHQTKAEVHCEHPYENKSDSSIDSIDTLPFANENTGTIKQKLYKQEIVSTLSLSSSSSSSSTNTIANVAQSLTSLKISPSLQNPFLASDDVPEQAVCADTLDALQPPHTEIAASQNDSLNVLNDIGNMLANLTVELDAMIEEEKRVGINDSE